jgi:hypothetical protein
MAAQLLKVLSSLTSFLIASFMAYEYIFPLLQKQHSVKWQKCYEFLPRRHVFRVSSRD